MSRQPKHGDGPAGAAADLEAPPATYAHINDNSNNTIIIMIIILIIIVII